MSSSPWTGCASSEAANFPDGNQPHEIVFFHGEGCMTVHLLFVGDNLVVTSTFRNAIRHAATLLVPAETEREALRNDFPHPKLDLIGASGSFAQRLRRFNEQGQRKDFWIEAHTEDVPPGTTSLLREFDLLNGPDPSYDVQSALWSISDGGRFSDVAESLSVKLATDLDRLRNDLGDEEALDYLRDIEGKMGGLKIIPQVGEPARVLERIPASAIDLVNAAFG